MWRGGSRPFGGETSPVPPPPPHRLNPVYLRRDATKGWGLTPSQSGEWKLKVFKANIVKMQQVNGVGYAYCDIFSK